MQRRCGVVHAVMIAVGSGGILFFSTVDFIHLGAPGLGMDQLAGIVISAIVVLAASRHPASPRSRAWFGGLLLLYVAGLMVMGLTPRGHLFFGAHRLLSLDHPQWGDFTINVLGFGPFAYLFMGYLYARGKPGRIRGYATWVVVFGFGLSLFIEILQYDLPGRTSSLTDVVANTIGTALGVAGFYLLYREAASGGNASCGSVR